MFRSRCKACRTELESARDTRNRQADPTYRAKRARIRRTSYLRFVDKNAARGRAYEHRCPEVRQATKARRRVAERASGDRFTGAEWRALIEKYGGRCLCCRQQVKKLTPDHVIPIAKGGANTIDNIQPLCQSCNCAKGAHHSTDYRLTFEACA
jgi:5-methylcytosine-specific restriction endonuclease McrA